MKLEPLALEDQGVIDLAAVYEPFAPTDPYFDMLDFFASTPRRYYRFHEIAWGAGVGTDPDDPDACLVADASELALQDPVAARELLMDALLADLRCIDARFTSAI